jgi:hypothetical protein
MQRSAEVVGLGFVEGHGLWLASPAGFVVRMQMLLLLVRALWIHTWLQTQWYHSDFRNAHYNFPVALGGVVKRPPRNCKYFTWEFRSAGFLPAKGISGQIALHAVLHK